MTGPHQAGSNLWDMGNTEPNPYERSDPQNTVLGRYREMRYVVKYQQSITIP